LGRSFIAGIAAVTVGLVIAFAGFTALMGLRDSTRYGTPIPTPAPQFDPSIDGPGIVHDVDMWLGLVPFLIAAAISAVLIVLAFRRDIRREKYAAGLASVVLLAGSSIVSNQPGPTFGDSWGPSGGIEVGPSADGTVDPRIYYIVAAPGDNFSVNFNVRNDGSLPVRLLGVHQNIVEEFSGPTWTSVGVGFDDHSSGGMDEMITFEPVELAPGDDVDLLVTGRAGPCAAGTPESSSGWSVMQIKLVYSVFGLSWTTVPELPFEVHEASREGCP
jgi:hypothetical protein